MKNIRLFLKSHIKLGQTIEINNNDFDYLIKVMRKKIDDQLLVFNGNDGEWMAKIIQINKKNCQLQIIQQNKEQYFPPKITLAFAPVKNVRIDFIAAKATELGITKFQPIITAHSVVDKINLDKFKANTKEAAEQCERLDIPEVLEVVKLSSFFKTLSADQILILCDESGSGAKASKVLQNIEAQNKEIIIFTGPEGGFSEQEFEQFELQKNLHKITLGPRILRADTAIICAATLVQEFLGDFDLKPNFD
ncbi:MAG: 16S rRNA (uracil1498-N3)-methyltransferase [Rickettsiales bacterium]|jgi:16S rRNA (uracil1498-N3)-methyltransferase